MKMIVAWLEILSRLAKELGPYVMLEIVLPGGTLFALLLFVYRRGGFAASKASLRATFRRLRRNTHLFSVKLLRTAVSPIARPIASPTRVELR